MKLFDGLLEISGNWKPVQLDDPVFTLINFNYWNTLGHSFFKVGQIKGLWHRWWGFDFQDGTLMLFCPEWCLLFSEKAHFYVWKVPTTNRHQNIIRLLSGLWMFQPKLLLETERWFICFLDEGCGRAPHKPRIFSWIGKCWETEHQFRDVCFHDVHFNPHLHPHHRLTLENWLSSTLRLIVHQGLVKTGPTLSWKQKCELWLVRGVEPCGETWRASLPSTPIKAGRKLTDSPDRRLWRVQTEHFCGRQREAWSGVNNVPPPVNSRLLNR